MEPLTEEQARLHADVMAAYDEVMARVKNPAMMIALSLTLEDFVVALAKRGITPQYVK